MAFLRGSRVLARKKRGRLRSPTYPDQENPRAYFRILHVICTSTASGTQAEDESVKFDLDFPIVRTELNRFPEFVGNTCRVWMAMAAGGGKALPSDHGHVIDCPRAQRRPGLECSQLSINIRCAGLLHMRLRAHCVRLVRDHSLHNYCG